MSDRMPAEVFSPGEYIQDELDARGWTQDDLAQILARPLNAVNQIIKGKRGITPETAKGLAAAFGNSAEFWMNLEVAYRLAKVQTEKGTEVSQRARLYSIAPINEMIRRGWILPGSASELEAQLHTFFATKDLDNIGRVQHAARKSTSYAKCEPPERAWCFRALQLARSVHAADFDADRFAKQLPEIAGMTERVENIRSLPAMLASLGVRLVLVAHLERTRLDGATFWPPKHTPVVALSLRYDRVDYFWHTLIHELVHVKSRNESIDSNLGVDAKGEGGPADTDELEKQVNAEAAHLLISNEKLESFVMRIGPLFSRKKVIQFAQANNVHPGIVVGRLHHRYKSHGDGIHWKNLRDLLVPVRSIILGQTITDGWGHTPGAF